MKQFPRCPSSAWVDAVARGETSPLGGWPTCPRCGHPAVLDAFGRCTDCAGEREGKPSRDLPPPPLPRRLPAPKPDAHGAHNSPPADWPAYIERERETIERVGGPRGMTLVAYCFHALSQKEIAERFEVEQGNVSRALEQLRKAGIRLPRRRKQSA